jgi:hypothetical protein
MAVRVQAEHRPGEGFVVRLSDVELILLNNALSKLRNGVPIGDSELPTRLGIDRGPPASFSAKSAR